jgi:hypothetical protein
MHTHFMMMKREGKKEWRGGGGVAVQENQNTSSGISTLKLTLMFLLLSILMLLLWDQKRGLWGWGRNNYYMKEKLLYIFHKTHFLKSLP